VAKKQYWLMKSEPDVYSIDDLKREKTTCWEGVRNYQARNNMQAMNVGDDVLYYHSRATPPGVAGLAKVAKTAYPDHFAFDKKHKYFDAKSSPDKPRWFMVDVGFVEAFDEWVTLPEIKDLKSLSTMVLVNNSRLSVQPVRKSEFDQIVKMGRARSGKKG
jgi:predicted RNA-binding protein with PUA-like domain